MKYLGTLLACLLMVSSMPAIAGERTVTLKVDGMTCVTCPYQVQSALKRVDGVKAATASLDQHNAVVTFDDAVTNAATLTKATADAGFPSVIVPRAKTKES